MDRDRKEQLIVVALLYGAIFLLTGAFVFTAITIDPLMLIPAALAAASALLVARVNT